MNEEPVTPDALARLLSSDHARDWRIDIETDSTIQSDVSEAQKNMSEFVTGLSAYFQAIGPAVQAGVVKLSTAADLLKAFSRVYKLGRSAETAIEEIGDEEMQQGQGPQGVDPAAEVEKQKAAVEQARYQLEMQKIQNDAAIQREKAELERQKIAFARMKLQMEMTQGVADDGERGA